MKIFSPILKGTTTVAQGTTNLSGSFTGSLLGTAATASYADNFTVGGTLTAQTINVQIITSSIEFNTGSTRNGALSTNTHEFTGSVNITGSATTLLSVNNSVLFVSASGNVGIGTVSPSTKFQVYESLTNTSAYLTIQNNRARNAAVYTVTSNGGFYAGTSIGTDTFNYQIYDGVAGVARLTIASTGAATFQSVNAKVNTGGWHVLVQDNTSMAAGVGGGISFNGYKTGTSAQGVYAAIDGYKENATAGNELGGFRIWTSNGTNLVERMRITSGGNLLVGQTADNPIVSHTAGARIAAESIFSNSSSECLSIQRMNSTGVMAVFYYWSGVGGYVNLGNISTNGSTITFSGTALSDARYKENIVPITNALESINQVDWVEFKFKENQKNSAGITAQQLQTVDALSKFVIDGSDEESYKAVDYNAIIGYLGKAIQELSAKNTSLEERLTALENN